MQTYIRAIKYSKKSNGYNVADVFKIGKVYLTFCTKILNFAHCAGGGNFLTSFCKFCYNQYFDLVKM